MSKSALVMNTPENCYDCPFGTAYCSDLEYEGLCELHYLAERWRIRMYSKCQKCGRKLTDPESIERGYGPECWGSILPHYSIEQEGPEESIPGQMTIEDFLGGLKNGGEKDMS